MQTLFINRTTFKLFTWMRWLNSVRRSEKNAENRIANSKHFQYTYYIAGYIRVYGIFQSEVCWFSIVLYHLYIILAHMHIHCDSSTCNRIKKNKNRNHLTAPFFGLCTTTPTFIRSRNFHLDFRYKIQVQPNQTKATCWR